MRREAESAQTASCNGCIYNNKPYALRRWQSLSIFGMTSLLPRAHPPPLFVSQSILRVVVCLCLAPGAALSTAAGPWRGWQWRRGGRRLVAARGSPAAQAVICCRQPLPCLLVYYGDRKTRSRITSQNATPRSNPQFNVEKTTNF